jgi:DegV family protein with EDD domain
MVRVLTESTADIPAEMAADLGITIVPSYVVFGPETYRDGVDLSRQEFYEKLETTHIIPTTGTPPPDFYEDAYRRLSQSADEIVSIHLAADLSALHDVALVAARNVPEARIVVVDSEQVTMGCGWMAIAAAEAARRGETLDQIVTLVEGMKERTHVFAVLDTLDYIYRGGRVGWVQAMVGTIMRIKPIIGVHGGQVLLLERARTWTRSVGRLLELVVAQGPLERAMVLHANAPEMADHLADKLSAIIPDWNRFIAPAGVTSASHVGPGTVGIACVKAGRDS